MVRLIECQKYHFPPSIFLSANIVGKVSVTDKQVVQNIIGTSQCGLKPKKKHGAGLSNLLNIKRAKYRGAAVAMSPPPSFS